MHLKTNLVYYVFQGTVKEGKYATLHILLVENEKDIDRKLVT